MNKVRYRRQAIRSRWIMVYDAVLAAEGTAMSKLRNTPTPLLLAAMLTVLVGCGPPAKADLLKKAASVKTKAELEQVLGKPADVAKLGPLEKWTYKAADGEVIFVIAGETVTMQVTGSAPKEK